MAKYGNKKVWFDGMEFDSIRERDRYLELKLLQRAGEISELDTQVKFELIPSQRYDGKVVERPVTYIADFVYKDKLGNVVVEDAKGHRTTEYILKRKMMLYFLGIRVREV